MPAFARAPLNAALEAMNATHPKIRWLVGLVVTLGLNHAFAVDYSCKHDLSKVTAVVEKHSSAKARLVSSSKDESAMPKVTVADLGKFIPALPKIMQRGLPYLLVEDAAGLHVAIYHESDRVVLVSILFPIVNIPQDRQDLSFDTLAEIVGTCVTVRPDVRTWLKAALIETWEIVAAQMGRKETTFNPVVQDVFGGTRLAVWGVPPDIWHILVMP